MNDILLLKKILEEDGRFGFSTEKSSDYTTTFVYIHRIVREDELTWETIEEDEEVYTERMYRFKIQELTINKFVKNIDRNLKSNGIFDKSQLDNRQLLYDILIEHTREGKIKSLLDD
jgi:hypothetical protein